MYQRAAMRPHGSNKQRQGGDMSHRKTLSRLTLASLVAAALAAPAASAMPTDPTGPRDAIVRPGTAKQDSAQQDRRGEAAAERSSPTVPRQLPGPPTWPMHPQPIDRAPANVVDGDGGGGDGVPVLAIIIGGALVLAGGTAVTVRHRARVAH
jgi:hypothetical protein